MINIFLRAILLAFACYRIAELLKVDDGPYEIITKLRSSIAIRASKGSRFFTELAKAIYCLYCSSMWIALVLAVLVIFPTLLGDFILVWLGAAGMVSVVLGRGESEE